MPVAEETRKPSSCPDTTLGRSSRDTEEHPSEIPTQPILSKILHSSSSRTADLVSSRQPGLVNSDLVSSEDGNLVLVSSEDGR